MGGAAVGSCRLAASRSWHDVIERERVAGSCGFAAEPARRFGLGPPAALQALSHPPFVLAEQDVAEFLKPRRRVDERPDDRLAFGDVERQHLHLAGVGALEPFGERVVDEGGRARG